MAKIESFILWSKKKPRKSPITSEPLGCFCVLFYAFGCTFCMIPEAVMSYIDP